MNKFKKILSVVSAMLIMSLSFAPTFTAYAANTANISVMKTSVTSNKKDNSTLINKLRKAFDNHEKSLKIENIKLDPDEMGMVFYEALADKKYFYVKNYSYYLDKNNKYVTEINIKYLLSSSKADSSRDNFYKCINNYVSEIDASWTDLQKITYVHDKLIINSDYRAEKDADYTAYGLLTNKIGCCTAYSTAFAMIMKEIGIKTSFAVTSDHMWNLVMLNGKWYNVDCTYDDPGYDGEGEYTSNMCRHSYFMLSSSALTDHNGAKTLYTANSALYDKMTWNGSVSPMVVYGSGLIYSDTNGVIRFFNTRDNKITKLTSVSDRWIDWSTYNKANGSYMYDSNMHISLIKQGTVMYYNTSCDVYSYDLKTGKKVNIFKYDPLKNSNLNMYGLRIIDNKLYGIFAKDAVSPEKLMLVKEL